MLKILIAPMVALFLLSPTVCVCISVNFVPECSKWAKIIENLLSNIFSSISVTQIHGDMDKNAKLGFIKLFTRFLWMVGYDPRVLVATSAANTGVDNCQLQLVNRFGFPCCPTALLQEWGCNALVAGMTWRYILFTSWMMFIKLAFSMFLPSMLLGLWPWPMMILRDC